VATLAEGTAGLEGLKKKSAEKKANPREKVIKEERDRLLESGARG